MNKTTKTFIFFNLFFLLVFLLYSCEGDTIHSELQLGCDSTDVTYLANVKTILETHCGNSQNNCHFNGAIRAGYNFDDYNAAKSSIRNSPATLICSIRHNAGCITMPNRNDASIKLSEQDIVTIEQWICLGYVE